MMLLPRTRRLIRYSVDPYQHGLKLQLEDYTGKVTPIALSMDQAYDLADDLGKFIADAQREARKASKRTGATG